MPPTVSLRRISEKRCVSDHDPRVSNRRGVGIAGSLVIAGKRIRLPSATLCGMFTRGAPGSLVGSRTTGDDSHDGPEAYQMAQTGWICTHIGCRVVALKCASRKDRRGIS